ALRTKMLTSEQAPDQLTKAATSASQLFTRELSGEQRDDLSSRIRGPQIDAVAEMKKWYSDEVSPAPGGIGLNRPLLGDVRTRATPVVHPLEQLQAVSGLAAIARRSEEVGMAGGNQPFPEMMNPEAMGQGRPQVLSPPATLLPYIVLTGLVPVRKQAEEYRSLYATATFRDPQRDIPRWSDFTVERQTLDATGAGQWKTIDLRKTVKRWGQVWAGVATEALPPTLMLSDTENPRDPAAMPIGFFGPLPQLAERPSLGGFDGQMGITGQQGGLSWGLKALHPWAVAEIEKLRKQQEEEMLKQQEGGLPGLPMADAGLSAGNMGGGFSGFPGSGFSGDPGSGDFFRFIDTDVEPGKAYRYRVTIQLWNPNVGLPLRFLEDASQANEVNLTSTPAEPEPRFNGGVVRVPGRSRILTRMLTTNDKKLAGLGSRDNEALVIDVNPDSGNFELHSTEIRRGQPIGIKKESKRLRIGNWRFSTPPHDVETDLTVIDQVGEQELDEKKRIGRGFVPAPPFELLLIDTFGAVEHVTPIESEKIVRDYL
ncbi:MAG: hypothetical protein EBT52_08685, partial [Flavobacteriia bacterium]|nr:hypothetical protein [Flavobacteriia bacterium]